MIKNYFTVAFRNLWKNKLYTVLNLSGLTFGITCFLLIGLYIFDELTFDQQHGKADRIFRVIEHKNINGEESTIAGVGYKLAEEATKKLAEVESVARISRMGRANLVNPDNPVNFQETITSANQSLLEIFDFPFLSGDIKSALSQPNSIIINEELALRLFGHTDVMGKALEYSFMESPLKITAVFKNHPKNSSFNFNNVISESSFDNSDYGRELALNDWLSNNFTVYVLLKPGVKTEKVSGKLKNLVLDNYNPDQGTSFSFSLQPLKNLHLKSQNIVDGGRNSNVEAIAQGNPLYIKLFSAVAFFILLIAGINYINLTTARAFSRLKEIGVRKTIGAIRSHLIRQFLLESLLLTFISFLLALLVLNLLLPPFNEFVNKRLSFGFTTDYRIWLYSIGFITLLGFVSGSYPALLLSRFKPTLLLKGLKLQNKNDLSLRKGLVVFQFVISIVMIVGTIVLFLQVRYLNNTKLGFNKDLLVVIDVNTGAARTNFEAIKTEMSRIPTVKTVSVTSRVPGEWKSFRRVKIRNQEGPQEKKIAYLFGADKDFLKTFEIDLLKGRNFNNASDSAAIMVNETAAKMLNITEPSDQLVEIPEVSSGETFGPVETNISFKPRVVGIVKDFHFQSLHNKIEPLVLAYNQNPIHGIDYYSVRIDPQDVQNTLAKLKAVMTSMDKNDPFEYHFLDEQLALFYLEDERRQTILIWVALATIFIACLGLFGLATYSAQQRIKEIGVRKVLGATVLNLTSLLSKDFIKLVFIANAIAFPIAWWGTNKWLQEYAYHIDLEWWIFLIAGLTAILIALITVSYQAIRAASANPVKNLRTE